MIDLFILLLQWATVLLAASFLAMLVREAMPVWSTLNRATRWWTVGLACYSLTTVAIILLLIPRTSHDWVDVVGSGFLVSFVLLHRALYLESNDYQIESRP